MNKKRFPFRVVPDFGSSSHISVSGHFFGNPAKSSSGLISSRIWQLPVQLIPDKKKVKTSICIARLMHQAPLACI